MMVDALFDGKAKSFLNYVTRYVNESCDYSPMPEDSLRLSTTGLDIGSSAGSV